ncbi:MAG: acylglycerol kinase family protein, partial [Candidatus Eisenbacteria bacterium]
MKTAAETCPAPAAEACPAPPAVECRRDPLGRCFLIINPGSRGGKGAEAAERYRGLLEEWERGQRNATGRDEPTKAAGPAGLAELACGYTRELDDARVLARRALDEGFDTVVAVGGDGTINRVVSAFMEAGAVRPADR